MKPKTLVFFGVTALGVLADQLTKAWIAANITLNTGEIPILPGFLSLVHVRNPGAAMGILRDFEHRQLLFAAFTVVAAAVLLDLFRRLPAQDRFTSLTLGLIFSGAIGNAIDRVRFRYVVDFIQVYTEHPRLKPWLIETVGTNIWPSFNIADSALVVGILLYLTHFLVVDEVDGQARGPNASEPPSSDGSADEGGSEAEGGRP